MNSRSDRPKSLEELKALNKPPQVETLSLLGGLLQRQARIEETLKTLATKENAETILNQTDSLNSCPRALQKQVGSLSESYTTSIENMEKLSRKSVRSLTSTARIWIILTAIISSTSILLLRLLSRLP